MAYKENDERLIGKNLKKLRDERGLSQDAFGKMIRFDRTLINKWERGSKIPSKDQIGEIAKGLSISADELYKNICAVIVHTSAMLENTRILGFLLEDYENVIIPDSVMKELAEIKRGSRGPKSKRRAWQAMMKISQYQVDNKIEIMESEKYGKSTIENIIELAKVVQEDQNGDVFIIHNDVAVSVGGYKDSLFLREYMARRSVNIGYYKVLQLMDEWEDFDEIDVDGVNLDAYLPDGMTLLIDCIRCNTKEKKEKNHNREDIETSKILQKIKFLLDHGADINLTDRYQHGLTPLAHCVQTKQIEVFDYLISRGADYNKGSIDTLNTSKFKMQNEGNTPLMIACYEGKKVFVDRFLKLEDVSYNQQDANGWTALIKAAASRNENLKNDNTKYIKNFQYIYDKLSSMSEVDQKIRDRQNRTAKDFWDNPELIG